MVTVDLSSLGEDDRAEFSLTAFLSFMIRHLRTLLFVPLLAAIGALLVALVAGRDYTARSQIVPEGTAEAGLGRYAALAAQVGVNLPGGLGGRSPEFYAALVEAPATLRNLAETRFEFVHDGERKAGTLVELLDIDLPTRHRTLLRAIKMADESINTRVDPVSGVLEITSSAEWPVLAELINRRLLELIGEFNDERRQRFASAEREFVEGRLVAVAVELRAAEARLQKFLEENREYESSSQLALAADRLRRDVSLHQQVYNGLSQSREQARIEEVRNTPQVTIVTPPEGTADRERLLMTLIRGGIVGLVLAVMMSLLAEWGRREAQRRPHEFMLLRRTRLVDIYARVVGRPSQR